MQKRATQAKVRNVLKAMADSEGHCDQHEMFTSDIRTYTVHYHGHGRAL